MISTPSAAILLLPGKSELLSIEHSQKNFNTGVVAVVVLHGAAPSRELIEPANGIRLAWIDFWSTTTGRRSTMTASPR